MIELVNWKNCQITYKRSLGIKKLRERLRSDVPFQVIQKGSPNLNFKKGVIS